MMDFFFYDGNGDFNEFVVFGDYVVGQCLIYEEVSLFFLNILSVGRIWRFGRLELYFFVFFLIL